MEHFFKVRRQPKTSHIQILSGKDVWVMERLPHCIFSDVFFWLKHISMEPQNSSLPTNHSFLPPERCLNSGFHRWWFLVDSPLTVGCKFSIRRHCIPCPQERRRVPESGRLCEGFPMRFFLLFSTVNGDSCTVPSAL